MIIQQDTREQNGKHNHVLAYFERKGIKVVQSKLFVGDYTLLEDQGTCIDTKQSVVELFSNLTKDHARFKYECKRAQDFGIKLIVLVEEKLPEGGLVNWKSPVWKSTTNRHKKGDKITRADPIIMKKSMLTMQERYGVEFRFCDKSVTGACIVALLERDHKERIENERNSAES